MEAFLKTLQSQEFLKAIQAIFTEAIKTPLGIVGLSILAIVVIVLVSKLPQKNRPYVAVAAIIGICFLGYSVIQARPALLTDPPKTDESPLLPVIPLSSVVTLPKVDCGQGWSSWVDVGSTVGSDMCPATCSRGEELGERFRVVGFPPRPQGSYKFQCWKKNP